MADMENRDNVVNEESFEEFEATNGVICIKFGEENAATKVDCNVSKDQLFATLKRLCKHFGFTLLPVEVAEAMAIIHIAPEDDS